MLEMARRAHTLRFIKAFEGAAEREGEAFLTPHRTIAIIALIFITTLLLLYLWQGWQISFLTGRLAILREELEILEAQKEMLLLEVAKVFSLKRIESIAKNRLGMIEPKLKYITLPPEAGEKK